MVERIVQPNGQMLNPLGFDELNSDPTNVTNLGYVYTKDVIGVTQLFYEDSAGVVYQITPGGALNNTLDQAYDQGGPGAGRIINVDSGPVQLDVDATQADPRGMFIDIDGVIGPGLTGRGIHIDADGVTAGAGETFHGIHLEMDAMVVGGTVNAVLVDFNPLADDAVVVNMIVQAAAGVAAGNAAVVNVTLPDITLDTTLTMRGLQINNDITNITTGDFDVANAMVGVEINHVHTSTIVSGVKTNPDTYVGRGIDIFMGVTTTGALDQINDSAEVISIQYDVTETLGTLQVLAKNLINLAYTTTGTPDYIGGGAVNMLDLTGVDTGVPTYVAGSVFRGINIDLDSMDVSDADLTLQGMLITMPVAYGVATEAAIRATGDGRTVELLTDTLAADFTGDVLVTGKLTVTGLIDPTGIRMTEQAADPGATGAGEGTFWVRNDAPNVPMFTDDAGTDHVLLFVGGAGLTLDNAYDGAGAGAGRIITVDSGAVEMNNDTIDLSNVTDFLTMSHDVAGTAGLAASITNTGDMIALSSVVTNVEMAFGDINNTVDGLTITLSHTYTPPGPFVGVGDVFGARGIFIDIDGDVGPGADPLTIMATSAQAMRVDYTVNNTGGAGAVTWGADIFQIDLNIGLGVEQSAISNVIHIDGTSLNPGAATSAAPNTGTRGLFIDFVGADTPTDGDYILRGLEVDMQAAYPNTTVNAIRATGHGNTIEILDRDFMIDIDMNGVIPAGVTRAGVRVNADGVTTGAGEFFHGFHLDVTGMTLGGTVFGALIEMPVAYSGGIEAAIRATGAGNVFEALNDTTGIYLNILDVTSLINPVDIDLEVFPSGTVVAINYSMAETLTGPLTGIDIDFNTNLTLGGNVATGLDIDVGCSGMATNNNVGATVNKVCAGALGADMTFGGNTVSIATIGVNVAAADFDMINSAVGLNISHLQASDSGVAQGDNDTFSGPAINISHTGTTSTAGAKLVHTSEAIAIDYGVSETAGLLTIDPHSVIEIDYDSTGSPEYSTGNHDVIGIDVDDAAVPVYAAGAIFSGVRVDLSGMDVSDADLQLNAILLTMPGAYGAATEAALRATGDGRTVQLCNDTFAGEFTGDVLVTGKLTVTGLIDPTGLVLAEQAADPGATGAGEGTFWVRNDAPNVPMFTDDAGTDHVLLFAGAAGLTLDNAYDGAGAGAGRVITVDSGPVQLDVDATQADPRGMFIDIDGVIGAGLTAQGIHIDADGVTAGVGETFYGFHFDGSAMTLGGTVYGALIDMPAAYGAGAEAAIRATGDGRIAELCNDTYSGEFTGDVLITGKLTVTGLIDPTGMVFTEQAAVPGGAPAAGDGVFWVRNDVPNTPMFTDDAGTDFVLQTSVSVTNIDIFRFGNATTVSDGARLNWRRMVNNGMYVDTGKFVYKAGMSVWIAVMPQSTNAAYDFDVRTDLGGDGESPTTHVNNDLGSTYNLTAGVLNYVDITSKIANLSDGDSINLRLQRNTAGNYLDLYAVWMEGS